MPQPARFSLTYRDILIAILIVLLAFALRVIVVFDRAHHDYAFDPLPPGSDQEAYIASARAFERGEWPRGVFFYQPGVIYYFIGIRALAGDSLGTMRLFTSLTGALSCGLLIGAGWLLTGRRWGGYLAGLLMAIYPVAIFWSTALLIPGLATFFVSLFLLLALWQREQLAFWRSVGLGITVGLLLITRSNLALLALAWLVYLGLIAHGWRRVAAHGLVFVIVGAVTVAPVTLWNIQQGEFRLVSGAGLDEVYRGNNRDADGLRSGSPAMDVVAGDYGSALKADILRDPLHFLELAAHKAGIYWSSAEPGNNLDYFIDGKTASPLLRAIPLDFRILSALGLLGLGVLVYDNRRLGVFFILADGLIFAGVMALWIEGRLRQPAVVPLVLSASYLLVRLPEMRARQWRLLAAPALLVAALFGFTGWTFHNLPVKHPVSGLPSDMHVVDIVYDGKLRFWGWRTLPEWTAPDEGWSVPGLLPYTVELFWEMLEPTGEDYNFYLAYVVDGVRYAGRDRLVGGISFPPHPTSTWKPGDIYSETAGFRLERGNNLPTGHSGEIQVGVYVWNEQGAIVNVPVTSPEGHLDYEVLQPFALVDLTHSNPPPENMVSSDLIFGTEGGDRIALLGYAIPEGGRPGESITLSFYWQALTNVRADYNLFVHVMDADNQLAAQHDNPPRDGTWVTSTWPEVMPVRDDITLTLPNQPGVYRVYFGIYHSQTRDRLPVDAPDYRPLLAEITIED